MSGIKGITLTAAGSGYTTVPTVTIQGNNLLSIDIAENKSSRNVQSFKGSGWTTAQGQVRLGNSTTSFNLAESASSSDSAYNTSALYIYEGTGAGEVKVISGYVGATRGVTTAAFSVAPDKTSKYMIGPAITISGGGGSQAEAASMMNADGTFDSIILTNTGRGYTSKPSVSFAGAGSSTVDPTIRVKTSEGAGATAVAKLVGTSINSITINGGGTNYQGVPTIEIISSNGEGSGATATCTLSGNAVNAITVTNGGSGYTAVPTVKFIPTHATDLMSSGTASTMTVATATAVLLSTEVDSIKMTNFGGGYREPPTVTFGGGGGTGATARAVLKDDNINARIKGEPPLKLVRAPKATSVTGLTPFPTFASGRRQSIPQLYKPGTLAMMKDGLYRVTGSEAINYTIHMGIKLETTTLFPAALGAAGVSVKVSDGEFSPSTNGTSMVHIPAGTYVVFGEPEQEQQTFRLKNSLTFTGEQTQPIMKIVPADTADTAIFAATVSNPPFDYAIGTTVTAMYIPGHNGDTNQLAKSEKRSFGDLEPFSESSMNGGEKSVYQVALGIGSQPKFVSANGSSKNVGLLDITPLHHPTEIAPGNNKILGQGNSFEPFDGYIQVGGGLGSGATTCSVVCFQGATAAIADLEAGANIQFIGNTDPETLTSFSRIISSAADSGTQDTVTGFDIVTLTVTVAWGADILPGDNNNLAFRIQRKNATAGDGGAITLFNTDSLTGDHTGGMKFNQIGGAPSDATGKLSSEGSYSADTTKSSVMGGMGTRTMVGQISPRVRVFQPRGTPKWTATREDQNDDPLLIAKGGWIDATDSPAAAPNPMYTLFMGAGEEASPQFQIMNIDESLFMPTLVLSGWKYKLKEVPEEEVKRMLRRSGRFNYEIIPYAQSSFEKGSDPAGPMSGWSNHVKKHKGRKMSFEEYKAATNASTDMTNNILSGSKSGMGKSRRDPRANHRRY